MNLLKETIHVILESGHTASDILFIGSKDGRHSCTWEEFRDIADIEYDDGFGSPKVALDLIVLFKDGTRMTRWEYDGSERWEIFYPVSISEEAKSINRLVANREEGGRVTIAEMHREMGYES